MSYYNPICIDSKMNHFLIPEYISGFSIIDAGANVGCFIERIREMHISSHIIAIEASTTNINILLKKKYENVSIMHKALVGNVTKPSVIFTEVKGLLEWGSATDINEHRSRTNGKRIKYEVETISLKDIVTENIDYLKMDIEGSETDVINTLTKDLAKRIFQISFETHNNDEEFLKDKLIDLGYDVFVMSGEIFCVRKDIKDIYEKINSNQI